MVAAAHAAVKAQVARINDLNVYPVPDGDTGTNMLLTLASALEEASGKAYDSPEVASKAVGEGRPDGRQGKLGGHPFADDPGRLRGAGRDGPPSTPKPSPPAWKGRANGPTPPSENRSRARC